MEPLSYWQQTAASRTLAATLPPSSEIVVVGGGFLGIATAYWIARTGRPVVLLERESLVIGATGRNGGLVGWGTAESYSRAIARFGYETALHILTLTRENRLLLHQLITEEAIDCDYQEGYLRLLLTNAEKESCVENKRVLDREGISTILLDREQVQELIALELGPDIIGGLLVPETARVHSVRLVQGIAEAAQRYGLRIVQAEVHRLEEDGSGVRLKTNQGNIRADAVVLALNAWTSLLLPALKNIITPIRGQMLAYAGLPPLFNHGMGAAVTNMGEYWQQTSDGTVILGGCRSAAPEYDAGILSNEPTTEVQQALDQIFPLLFPQIADQLQVIQRWAGVMAFTPDLLPIVDRVANLPGSWFVGGFCGHGMPYGLRLGQLLAEAVTQGTHPSPLLPFQLTRPTLPN